MVAPYVQPKTRKHTIMRMSGKWLLADMNMTILATPVKELLVFETKEHALRYGLMSGTFEGLGSFYLVEMDSRLWDKVERSGEYILMEEHE